MLDLMARLTATPVRVGGILELPFQEFADACVSAEARDVLALYARRTPKPTLRSVLVDPRFRRWVTQAGGSSHLRKELEEELSVVHRVVEEEEGILAEAPRPSRPPKAPPTTGKEKQAAFDESFVAWAVSAGVSKRLRDPAAVLSMRVPAGPLRLLVRHLKSATVATLIDGSFESPVVVSPRERDALARYAKAFVREAGERALAERAHVERVVAEGYVPGGEGVREFLAVLAEALARPSPRSAPDMRMTDWALQDDPVRIAVRAELPAGRDGRARRASLALIMEDWRNAPLVDSVRSDAKDGRTAEAARVLLVGLQRVLGDPQHAFHKELVGYLNETPWSRVLERVGGVVAKRTARTAGARIEWRVTRDRRIRITPFAERPDRRPGVVDVPLDSIAKGTIEASQPLDEQVAAVLGGLSPDSLLLFRPTTGEIDERERTFRALTLLAGRDNVRGSRGAAMRVVHGALEVALEGDDEVGYRFHFAVSGERLRAQDVRAAIDERGYLIHLEPEAGRIVAAHVGTQLVPALRALASEKAEFPASARASLVDTVVAFADSLPIRLPASLAGEGIEANARPLVRVVRDGFDTLAMTWLVRPVAGGAIFATADGPHQILQQLGGRPVVANRSFEEERLQADVLRARLPADAATRCEGMRDVLAAIETLRAAAEAGEAVVEWPKSLPRVVGKASWSKLRLKVTEQRDWFGLNGSVEIDGEEVSLAELLAARRNGQAFVVVGPDKLVALEDELRARLGDLEVIARAGKGGLALTKAAVPALAELVASRDQLEGATSFWSLLERIDAAEASEPKLPRGFSKVLRSYQIDGFRWMSRLAAWGAGACLADEMGLGKTVQTLALLVARSKDGPALVVAPTSVGPNWIAEAKRFAPGLKTILSRGAERIAALAKLGPGDLLVTSYDLMARDIDELSEIRFSTVVIDEAQAIKNGGTARSRAARQLRADFRLALTGTPVENRLSELYSLMEFLNPEFFGSEAHFRERWVVPIERDKDALRSAALARLVRPFMLRRLKAQVLTELPARTEVTRGVERSAEERKLYETARLLAIKALAGADEEARFRVLAEIMRLRRLACHPRLDDPASTVESSKLATFLELVDELREGGHRALVFSQFTGHLALVQEALRAREVPYVYLDGKTPLGERTKRVAAFQAGEGDLFLISLKAGGTGLNLTGADTVIHLDPWWNPAVEDQATDRAHRIGQTKPVTVIRLIAQGTIEEAVMALHGEKRHLAEAILEGSSASGTLSIAELSRLIQEGV